MSTLADSLPCSLRYHLLHPDYLYFRIRELQKNFKLRVVLCHVDVVSLKSLLLKHCVCCSYGFLDRKIRWNRCLKSPKPLFSMTAPYCAPGGSISIYISTLLLVCTLRQTFCVKSLAAWRNVLVTWRRLKSMRTNLRISYKARWIQTISHVYGNSVKLSFF